MLNRNTVDVLGNPEQMGERLFIQREREPPDRCRYSTRPTWCSRSYRPSLRDADNGVLRATRNSSSLDRFL